MPSNEFDTLNISEACQNCPSLPGHLRSWTQLQAITDALVHANLEQPPEDFIASMPDEIVYMASVATGIELDPGLEADKRKAFDLMNSRGYEHASEHLQTEEVLINKLVARCEEKGPLKVRVPADNGEKVIVKICRGEINDACAVHTHTTQVDIKKETR